MAALLLAGCAAGSTDADGAPAEPPASVASSTTVTSTPIMVCPDSNGGGCLGTLPAGTYTTRVFTPAITYVVPDGWYNGEDLPGNVLLHRLVDDQSGALGGSYIGFYQGARAPSRDCRETPQADVGDSARELMDWVTGLPSVSHGPVRPVSIGGLDGLQVDLTVTGAPPCTFEGLPATPIIMGSGTSQLFHVAAAGLQMRLIVLDWAGTNVTIEVTSIDEDIPASDYRALVAPILDSVRFDV